MPPPTQRRRLRPVAADSEVRAGRDGDVAAVLVAELNLPTGPQGWQEQQARVPGPHLDYRVTGDGLEAVTRKIGQLLHREEDRTRDARAALDAVREERDRALILLRLLTANHAVPPNLIGPCRTLLTEVGTLQLEREVRAALEKVIAGPPLEAAVEAAITAAVVDLGAAEPPAGRSGLLGPHPSSLGTGLGQS